MTAGRPRGRRARCLAPLWQRGLGHRVARQPHEHLPASTTGARSSRSPFGGAIRVDPNRFSRREQDIPPPTSSYEVVPLSDAEVYPHPQLALAEAMG
jgi:hypothetical protein